MPRAKSGDHAHPSGNLVNARIPKLKLMFDPKLIQASGLQPPFELNELELQDQGQMARLSFQANALVLTR